MPGWLSGFFGRRSAERINYFSENPEKPEKEEWKKQRQEEAEQLPGSPSDYPAKKIREGKKYHVSLDTYLNQFCKQDKGIKDEDSYEIRFLRGGGHPKNLNFSGDSIYCDGPYAFALLRRAKTGFNLSRWFESAIALISFRIFQAKKSVKIVQIQGVKGKHSFLKPLRWERMLVNIVIDWAKANGFKAVEIQRGKDNRWYAHSENKDGFKIRYDVTAERCGFGYDKKRKVHVLSLRRPAA